MTITDTCKYGAKFQVSAHDTEANGWPNHNPEHQHKVWLDSHEVCRTEPVEGKQV